MGEVLIVLQIIFSIALIGLILVQARGTGFGRSNSLGGSSSFTRRGLEKLIFKATFVVAFGFIIIAILSLVV